MDSQRNCPNAREKNICIGWGSNYIICALGKALA